MEKTKTNIIKLLILTISLPCFADRFYVFDIGQGSTHLYQTKTHCYVFDVGGEKDPTSRIKKLCEDKTVKVHISHMDWDHISYLIALNRKIKLCLHPKSYKMWMNRLKSFKSSPGYFSICRENNASESAKIKLIYEGDTSSKKRNARSLVFLINDYILIPGDSEKKQEKHWARRLPKKDFLLVLGHHGSNTSTYFELLAKMKKNSLSVASSRKSKYGHPHKSVLKRLENKKIPSISTEDWGNLIFEM